MDKWPVKCVMELLINFQNFSGFTFYTECKYLFMLGLRLIYVCKWPLVSAPISPGRMKHKEWVPFCFSKNGLVLNWILTISHVIYGRSHIQYTDLFLWVLGFSLWRSAACFKIKTIFSRYRDSHFKDTMAMRLCDLDNGYPYTSKIYLILRYTRRGFMTILSLQLKQLCWLSRCLDPSWHEPFYHNLYVHEFGCNWHELISLHLSLHCTGMLSYKGFVQLLPHPIVYRAMDSPHKGPVIVCAKNFHVMTSSCYGKWHLVAMITIILYCLTWFPPGLLNDDCLSYTILPVTHCM